MHSIKTIAIGASFSLLLAACASAPKGNEAVAQAPSKPVTAVGADARGVAPAGVDALNDPSSILAKRSVYFGFDDYSVKPEATPLVVAHATYLAKNPRHIRIQGNTDDRGGSEYNLALGQKRAEAVRHAMVTLGVPESQLEAVSYGKEKPKAEGENEAAWAENRRDDIVYGK
ncbi:MAG TPA: peptidoglycan-associated lipoprotein Pal [Janthinobacterium sp.]|nr:peptidoglycan-associated lipoprotein Pal [Janthinobacterium sp.]